jgi:hypothetical protein
LICFEADYVGFERASDAAIGATPPATIGDVS